MREFFIKSFDKLVAVLVVIMALGVLISAFTMSRSLYGGFSFWSFLLILVGGFVSIVATAGSLYLVLGIYENTKRTAQAMEELARKERS